VGLMFRHRKYGETGVGLEIASLGDIARSFMVEELYVYVVKSVVVVPPPYPLVKLGSAVAPAFHPSFTCIQPSSRIDHNSKDCDRI